MELDVDAAFGLDALKLREEVDMEVRATVFAVGNPAQSEVLLERDDSAYRLVLDGAKLPRIDWARPE